MKANNAVGLSKFKHLIRLLRKIQTTKRCQIEFVDDGSEVECQFSADHESYQILNRHILLAGRVRLLIGMVCGFLLGLLSAYVIIPSGATYLYSSDQGLIPPQYDALFKTKKPHEQVIQILTHESQGEKRRRGGPFRGNQMLFATSVNDSTQIQLWYKLSKKSIIANIGQKKGEEFIKKTVQKSMDNSGIDSAAKYYAGIEGSNVADQVSDAVSRTTAMKVEQGFLSQPVIRIIVNGKRTKTVYTNFLPWEGSYNAEYSIKDSDPAHVPDRDNCVENRKERVPIPQDQLNYNAAVKEFIKNFLEQGSIH